MPGHGNGAFTESAGEVPDRPVARQLPASRPDLRLRFSTIAPPASLLREVERERRRPARFSGRVLPGRALAVAQSQPARREPPRQTAPYASATTGQARDRAVVTFPDRPGSWSDP